MKQRVLIAIAIALQPDLIIADEPTSALDVTVQKRILDLLDILRRESGTAVLFVTHDLALAAERADRIMVFRQGEIQEQGATETIVQRPQHPYTRQLLHDLLDAPLRLTAARHRPLATPAIRVEGISKRFSLGKQALQALDSVSFEVRRGSTHALVGESGSGKTTLARILLGFERADAGQVIIDGIDAGHLSREAQRQLRRKIQFVYQNPFASLDPRQTLFAIIEEPLKNFERLSAATRRQRVESVAARVALAPELLSRTPRELSGGQRQRVAIARALILEPAILVLDEATSALDVTVQAQILALLQQLQQQLGLSYLFITHDLATVRRIADSVTVLRAGQVVEHGDVNRLFAAPQQAYTRELIAAIPQVSPRFSTGPHGERIMPKRLGFLPVCSIRAPRKRATGWRPNRSATRSVWASTAHGLPSTIFMNRKAACLHRWCFSPTSRRRPTGSASVQRLSPCRWKIRCASPKTQRYWIYSPTDVWRWVLAPAARQPRFCPSA